MVIILESSGRVNVEGDGFAKPIQSALDSLDVSYKVYSLKNDFNLLLNLLDSEFIRTHYFIISGGLIDLNSKSEWFTVSKTIIKELVLRDAKLMGICFGAQMIFNCLSGAKLILGSVCRMGVAPNLISESCTLVNDIQNSFFLFHCDGMLYSDSIRNHFSEITTTQVRGYTILEYFKISNKHIFGTQFHFEFNSNEFKKLINENENFVLSKGYSVKELKSKIAMKDKNYELLKRFLEG